jgi:hypothetical protein
MSATLEYTAELIQATADSANDLAAWRNQGHSLAQADSNRQFEIGEWIIAGEERWQKKAYKEAATIFRAYGHNTLKQFASVARNVPAYIRIYDSLRWGHYQIIARFPKPEYQQELLAKAAECEWAVATFREYVNEKHPPVKKKRTPLTMALPAELEKQVLALAKLRGTPYKETVLYLVEQALQIPAVAEQIGGSQSNV